MGSKITPAIRRDVDELGAIAAQIAELRAREGVLKQKLIDNGNAEFDGYAYRATVSYSIATRLDTAKVRAYLTRQNVLNRFTASTQSIRVNIKARLTAAA